MLTEVMQRIGPDECGGRGRHQHLAAVTRGCDPRGAVDIRTDVSLARYQWRASVEADADADPSLAQRLTNFFCCGETTGRCREGDEEGITLGVDLDAAVAADGIPDDAAVLGPLPVAFFRAEPVVETGRAPH